jgi:hypothetical protein
MKLQDGMRVWLLGRHAACICRETIRTEDSRLFPERPCYRARFPGVLTELFCAASEFCGCLAEFAMKQRVHVFSLADDGDGRNNFLAAISATMVSLR